MIWVQNWEKGLLGGSLITMAVDDSVVTKGIEKATNRPIALKKLLTHNPRDGVGQNTNPGCIANPRYP